MDGSTFYCNSLIATSRAIKKNNSSRNLGKKMKKIFFSSILFLCASCTTTGYVVSDASFGETNQVIKEDLKNIGYYQTGKTRSSEYDGTISTISREMTNVTGSKAPYNNTVEISANNRSSIKTELGKYNINKYCFEKESGDTIEYQVSYYKSTIYDKLSHNNVVVLSEISLIGCSTNNKKEYDEVCGNNGIVARNITNPKNQKITVENSYATAIAAYIAICVAGLGGLIYLGSL